MSFPQQCTQRLTPSGQDCYIGIDASDDWLVGWNEEQGGLPRPQDLHAVVQHAAAESDKDEDVISERWLAYINISEGN